MTSLKNGAVSVMNKTDEVCACCQKPKYRLRARRSKLLNAVLLLCDTCYDNKYEPRPAIILVGRRDGIDAVAEYIRNHRYVGEKILAEEFVSSRRNRE